MVNGVIYGLILFLYAAFDRVLVGLESVAIMAVLTNFLLFSSKSKPSMFPFTLYSAVAYTLSTLATVLIRFR